MSRSLTIGTAGHVDHGKTALALALTGVDTDRLVEEHRRGISIELGYAPLVLASGRRVSLVDVPGHERFISTMVAGATGIDLVLIVVACNDGVMPQTREHVSICAFLGIERAVVALTKRDLVDALVSSLARAEVEELLVGTAFEQAEIVECSVLERESVERVRAAIERAADVAVACRDGLPVRLPVDRAFTLRGIGSVVTGTLWSGSIGAGDRLVLAPGGREVRVRSVEVHDESVDRAAAGRRVAASIVGVDAGKAHAGQTLVERDAYPESFRLDVRIEALSDGPGLAHGALVRVLHGTADIEARVVLLDAAEVPPGGRAFAQLRLRERVVSARGDRLIVRRATPPATVAGGTVLDPAPERHGGATAVLERLDALEHGDTSSIVASALAHATGPISLGRLAPSGIVARDRALEALERLEQAGSAMRLDSDLWIDTDAFERVRASTTATLEEHADSEPLQPALPIAVVLPFEGREMLVEQLIAVGAVEREGAFLLAPRTRLRAADVHQRASATVLDALETSMPTSAYLEALATATELTADAFRTLIHALERDGEILRLGNDIVCRRDHFTAARTWVERQCQATGSVTLAALRDELGTSRRIAQAILERLDADGVTRRVGDERFLRHRRATG